MSSMSDTYDGDFLTGLDLEKPIEVTIERLDKPNTRKDSSGKVIERAILAFKGAKKELVLNVVNHHVIRSIHGRAFAASDTEEKTCLWIGKKITLGRRYLKDAFGTPNAICVRVLPPVGHPIPMNVIKHMGKDVPFSEAELKKKEWR